MVANSTVSEAALINKALYLVSDQRHTHSKPARQARAQEDASPKSGDKRLVRTKCARL